MVRGSRFVLCAHSRRGAPPQRVGVSSRLWRAGLDRLAIRLWLGSLLLGSALAAGPAEAATFVVNSVGDEGAQGNRRERRLQLDRPGTCTLRAAIEESNGGGADTDTITFAIPPAGSKTIVIGSKLPDITSPVIIDGTTQTGSVGGIELDFHLLTGTDPGIVIANGGGDPTPGPPFDGSVIRGLVINRCPGNAIRIIGSSGNIIARNYIGTDRLGTTCNAALGNLVGVRIEGTASDPSNDNLIGGAPGDGNVISGSRNSSDGIQMQGQTGGGATSRNTIRGNYIGTDVNGTGTSCGNSRDGIQMFGPGTVSNNVIAENVISGNVSQGIWMSGASTTGTVIRANKIGTNAAGTGSIPNPIAGVTLESGTNNNIVGGTTTPDRNLISGNANGIQLNNASNNLIQGNYIGTNWLGTAALPNTGKGIVVYGGGSNNTIGGTAPDAGNVISGNSNSGIQIQATGANGNIVQGNKIGTNAAGTGPVPNDIGISISWGPDNNVIGGTAADAGNLIASNTNDGIQLIELADATLNNAILGNTFHSNGGLGIDLKDDGVTANDAGDGDIGPSDLLNYPLLTASHVSGANLTTYFQLDVPAGSYRIEFFRNPSGADGSGFGEGQVFAGTSNVTHPGGGALPFNHIFPGVAGDVITATATRCTDGATCAAFGNTSEFSKALNVATTAVTLLSFTAEGRDRAVDLTWTTASELSNLGFHLYRAEAAGGPFTRITPSLIPGLGSSATGQSYAYRDSGLVNGRTYYYQLEDVETTGRTERHGPVSATHELRDEGRAFGFDLRRSVGGRHAGDRTGRWARAAGAPHPRLRGGAHRRRTGAGVHPRLHERERGGRAAPPGAAGFPGGRFGKESPADFGSGFG